MNKLPYSQLLQLQGFIFADHVDGEAREVGLDYAGVPLAVKLNDEHLMLFRWPIPMRSSSPDDADPLVKSVPKGLRDNIAIRVDLGITQDILQAAIASSGRGRYLINQMKA